jgi:flagellar secretion chaperone FliS
LNANPLNAYRETKVRTASQGRLIVMLYDEAIRQLDLALEGIRSRTKQLDKVHNAIVKAQDVVTELMVSLDFERGGEIARNLFSLYVFFSNQLSEGNLTKQVEPIASVRRLMAELRNAWVEAARKTGEVQGAATGVNLAG